MFSVNILCLIVILAGFYFTEVDSLKCFMCSSQVECQNGAKPLTTCDHNSVDQTSRKFYLLPSALSQMPSTDYFCTQYKIFYGKENMTNIHIEGCVYSTYSPCDGNQTPHMGGKIKCLYCNQKDGCNSASQLLQNIILIKFIIFTVYLSNKIICY